MNATLVAGTVLTDSDDVVLVQEADTGKWNIPAGRIESGEGLLDGAVRETREECGLTPDLEAFLGVFTLPDEGETVVYNVFLAELGDRKPEPNHSDISQAVRVPIPEVSEYDLRSGFIEQSLQNYRKGVRQSLELTNHLDD